MRLEIWPEVDAIVAEALELAAAERGAFLQRVCADRPEIAGEVDSLLRASSVAGAFLEGHTMRAGVADGPGGGPVPARVGAYRLLEEIGHGGMSVVYRAERDDGQFRKQAAVKLLAPGWISPEAMRRFGAERQILAALDHPNICRLLDGGVTAEAVPYLVMDFVEGVRLLDYCRGRALNDRARLQLFRKICQAVQYAHQNLIVHCDIKPGNVLVTRDGEVKLMDFGIAKVLVDSGSDQTKTRFAAMTPDYASPEQVKGGTITTQSDIYSLGVLLYELLTGRRPYESAGRTLDELLKVVSEAEAPPLRGLAAELLAIVRCAMSKEPGGRYATASALDEDVERYLAGKPVRAVSPSRWYLLRKWIGRHRAPVVAGSAAAILVLASTVFALWSARVARRERTLAEARFQDVRRLADKLLFDYPQALSRLNIATDLQLKMANDSMEYLDALARTRSSDPGLMVELAKGYTETGWRLGAPQYVNLGNRPKAVEAFGKARAILDGLLRQEPNLRSARIQMAEVLRRMSQVDSQNAAELARQSLSLSEDLHRQAPGGRLILRALGLAHARMAELEPRSEHARQAIGFLEAWVAQVPQYPLAVSSLAYPHRLWARHLLALGSVNGAMAEAQAAEALDERAKVLAKADVYGMERSFDLSLIAICQLRWHQLARARDLFDESTRLRRAIYQSDPGDEWVQEGLLEALNWSGWVAESQGDWKAMRSFQREAVTLAPTLTAVQSNDAWNTALGFAYASEGLTIRRFEHRPSEACRLLREAASHFQAVQAFEWPEDEHRAAQVRQALAACQ